MREISYMEALREAIRQAMEKDERVFVIGEDIGIYGGAFGVTSGLLEQFGPQRIIDTPISEAGIAGACVGASITGMRPIGEIQFSDFVVIAMDQLVMQGAKMRFMFGGKAQLPFVIRLASGSGTGAAAQHSESLENWFVHVPGLKVVMPSSPYDAKGLLLSSLAENNPVMFFEHKLLYKTKGPVPEEMYTIPLGQSHVVRDGSHLTIIATSVMVMRSQQAAEILSKEGIEVEIIDPRTMKPLDMDPIIKSVIKTGKALIVHEAVKTGGFGGEIAAAIMESEAFAYLDAPVRRLAGLDMPIPYNRTLEYNAVPQVENIVEEARKLVKGTY
jgi:acetoin:2,6-dichlorophenolindophenol oxidoreductase subunit beta